MPFAFWSVSGSLFQRLGPALQNDHAPEPECFLSEFSLKPEMLSLLWEEEQGGRDGLSGDTSSCRYCGAFSCTSATVGTTLSVK